MMKRLIFSTIALAIVAGEARAQNVKGGPEALVGFYGSSPDQCRSYHRKSDNLTSFTKTTYTFCGGSGCEAHIISHRRIKDGYTLKFTSGGNPQGWSSTFRQIDTNIFEETSKGSKPQTLVRCTVKDAIAGIGRDPNATGAVTQSLEIVYAAFYAVEVSSVCPDLRANQDKIKTLILAGRDGWTAHLIKNKLITDWQTAGERIRRDIEMSERSAKYGVRADSEEIPDFCVEVLGAFGSDGRILPDLIADPRKKA
jgi:hypothetical protein